MIRTFQRSVELRRSRVHGIQGWFMAALAFLVYALLGKLIADGSGQVLIVLFTGAIIIIILTKTWAGLLLLLFLSPFYGYFRYSMDFPDIYALWKESMVIILTLGWFIRKVVVEREKLVSCPANLPLILFLALATIQFLRAPGIIQGLFGFRIIAAYIPIYMVTSNLSLSKKKIKSLVVMILVIGVITAAYGIWQHLQGLYNLEVLGLANVGSNLTTMGQLRVFSTFAGPEYLGLYMVLAIIIGASLLVTNLSEGAKIITLAGIAVMFTALVFTLVRLEWILFGLGLILLSILAKKPRFVVLLTIATIVLTTAFPSFVLERAVMSFSSQDASFVGRKITYFDWNIPNIIGNPLGVGLGATSGRFVYMRVTGQSTKSELIGSGSTESGFANIALELGLPGLVLFLWFFFTVIKYGMGRFRQLSDPFLKWLAAAIVVYIILIALANITGAVMQIFPAGDLYFWFLVGLLVVLEKAEKEENLDTEAAGSGYKRVMPQ